ncbi:MAG: galactose mutarotase [Clostridiales Family XIII bacterium]|jgi:aldose 1-epimerase|nr:galactose mutarotase [Clostridiales Family XIII bacterium]
MNAKITTEPFGSSPATLIRIANAAGSVLTLTDLGATVVALIVPARGAISDAFATARASSPQSDAPASHMPDSDSASGFVDVALGYGSYDDYMAGDKYFGATIGRYANRIARGELAIGGSSYELDRNQAGRHTLHGGSDGWHLRIWQYAIGADSVTFTLHSPDGDQGFPGNADVKVTYTLTDDDTVRITYHAASDADTVFNLTNHTYFNLDGEGAGSVMDHFVRINSSRFVPTDADSIPTGGLRDADGSAFDFRREKRIGQDIDADDEQLALAGGYDHNFVIDGYCGDSDVRALRTAAVVRSEITGVEMTVRTDLPGVQFYTGNYLGTDRPSKSGLVYERRSGFCLETQFFPDSPHHANFPSTVFRAGEPFDSVTEYSFALT